MSKGHTQGRSQAVERVYPVLRHLVRTHNQLQIGKVNLYRESPARDADVATRVTIAWDDDTSTYGGPSRLGAEPQSLRSPGGRCCGLGERAHLSV